jgi:CRISPR-associated protein Cmr3
MNTWIIEPRDPVIFRDARPFSSNGGGRSVSLPFPFPSTIAGGVRTRAFLNEKGSFDPASFGATLDDVRRLEMRGPFLVELKEDGSIADWLFPAPLDALAFTPNAAEDKSKTIELKRLVPLALPNGVQVSRPFEELCPVGLAKQHKGKPSSDAPKYWKWSEFEKWLVKPEDRGGVPIASLGHDGPQPESRTHVGLDPETLTSEDGRLFQTRGLEFTRRMKSEVEGVSDRVHRLAIAIQVNGDERLRSGLAPLGGERRLVEWRSDSTTFPPCPDGVREAILRDGACRMFLTTPGYFTEGWRPSATALNAGITELGVEIVGAVVPRPVVVSGWDFEKSEAKPTRRLVPAGSVYFLKLSGSETARAEWVDRVWSSPIGDDEQSCRDGFGCALLGAWDGQPVAMEGN